MIAVQALQFAYPGAEFRLHVDRLHIKRGERVALVGPSGTGKTTLLQLIAGIATPTSGRLTVNDTPLPELPEASRRAFRITRMGLVFQEFELLEHLEVLDNILLPYRLAPTLTLDRAAHDRAATLASQVGIADKLRRLPRNLSQGERQRVAICRALVTEPAWILADEPTGNLDPENRDRVLALLFETAARINATLIAVTHDPDALPRFERVLDARDWS